MRFLMVDRILALVPGESCDAEKTLPAAEELFRDHFPGFAVVPGVLLTEMMAQTAGKALNAQRLPRGNAMLVEIRNAKFRSWVKPDETVSLHARIERDQGPFALAQCQASVGGRRVSSAELMFSFVPTSTLAPEFRDDVLETWLARHAGA